MHSPSREPAVELRIAPAALRARAPCVIVRRVAADATREERAVPVHANTFACLNVVVQGGLRCEDQLQPARFFAGPSTRPRPTVAEGALASVSLVLQPWLLEPAFGLRPDAVADRLVDAAALDCPWLDTLCGHLARGAFEPAWQVLARHTDGITEPDLALSALKADGVAAAARALGRSERQYRRDFRRALGLAPATWLRVRRWEEAAQGLLAAEEPQPLAEVAAGHGFADQAHLTRETRSFVAQSPARLRAEPAVQPWSLAPARVRILQDAPDDPA